MSPEDTELVQRFHACVAGGDLEGALRCLDTEARFDWTESIAPFRGLYVGHEGFRQYWAELDETWENFAPRIDDVLDCGDRLLTPTTVSGRARGSGIEIEAHGAVLWTVEDGRIVEAKLYQTAADALRSLQSA